ncbi:hypothetical protein Patl1_29035 [Pistacia atlantica]|uniref:Uncharacterized protein n=1 Tax=Pistacia atlantica TaxID=434234 RepID=A0ACC1BD11_9ROSI|nr:hypothetical protein Patl1_29035 [Pistacia atlantica]
MAAAAACKRVGQIGTNSGINVTRFRGFGASDRALLSTSSSVQLSASLHRKFDCRQISQLVPSNGSRLFLVDTLALVRRLEGQGVPSKQAEAITAAIIEVLNDSLENVSQSVVSKAEMQKSVMVQESNLSQFKSQVQSSQDHHFSLLQHETEKLRNDIEKMRSELRYEIDKVTAGQRLDLNLERGRIREELANQNAETSNLTNKLDREIHELRAQLEAAKYDVIKYCIGTLVSISAVGLAVVRILM